jgi:predicted enzyme related to lactoylglutathione lyase
MRSVVSHVTVDCRDPYALGLFWAAALHGRLQDDDQPGDPEALVTHGGTPLLLVQVPDGKIGKNRVHLDLTPVLPREEEVARLVDLGATVVADRTRPDGTGWVVMADPEGNELCVERSLGERGMPEQDDRGWREMPPVRTADERSVLEAQLEWYREGVVRKVDGMSQADATTAALRSPTTAAGIVKHLALVEDSWFTVRLGRLPVPEPWAAVDFTIDPDWEFRTATEEPLAGSVALYLEACARSRTVVAGLPLDAEGTSQNGTTFSLRWALVHMLEETARHLGHLDVLRELADGTTGG